MTSRTLRQGLSILTLIGLLSNSAGATLSMASVNSSNPVSAQENAYLQWVLANQDETSNPQTADSLGATKDDGSNESWMELAEPTTDDEVQTLEMPDFEAKTQGPKGPVRIAPPRANLPMMKPGMPNLTGTIDSSFANYSQSRGATNLVLSARSHLYRKGPRGRAIETYVVTRRVRIGRKKFRTVRMTYCWRAVKDALHSSGMVASSFGAGSANAYEARAELLREGFRDLLVDPRTATVMRNPDMAPKGAIMVYEDIVGRKAMTGNRYPGHAEIKTTPAGKPGYISISEDYKADYGMFAAGKRKLIGVMVRDT